MLKKRVSQGGKPFYTETNAAGCAKKRVSQGGKPFYTKTNAAGCAEKRVSQGGKPFYTETYTLWGPRKMRRERSERILWGEERHSKAEEASAG